MQIRYLIFILVSITALGSYYLCKKPETQNNATFVVGTVAGYAPWVSVNKQGEYEGFDVDVMNALAKQMNKQLVLKDLGSMSALFMALEQGKIDAIMWAMSITEDRLKKMAMIRYQGDTVDSFPLLFWEKIPSTITSIKDMAGKTVCVEPASSQDTVLSKYTTITKMPTEKVDDALLNIQYGKADAALVEPAIAKKFKKKYPQIKTIDVSLAPEDQVQGVGICIKKDNTTLITKVQQATDALLQQGVIQIYESKWDIS